MFLGISDSYESIAFKFSFSFDRLENSWYCFTSFASFDDFLANFIFFFVFTPSVDSLFVDFFLDWFSSLMSFDLYKVCLLAYKLISYSLNDLLDEWEYLLVFSLFMWLCLIGVSD